MRMKRFGPWKNENSLRHWVSWQLGKRDVYWVEPRRGSTFGVPDCFYFNGHGGRTIWLELKIGQMRKGRLSYDVRPGQKRILRRLTEQDVPAYILVGIEGEKDLYLTEARGEIIEGSFSVIAPPDAIIIEKLDPAHPRALKNSL